ncbi:TPA: hypothetical protein ACF2XI_000731 [Escherichia coli]
MSIEHILIGKHHGGSDCWRTPSLLFRNLHREFSFSMDGAATKHDTLLPLTIINRGGLRGRPTIYPPETLDSFIKLYRQGKTIKYIADVLRMPLSTSYRIAQRLS